MPGFSPGHWKGSKGWWVRPGGPVARTPGLSASFSPPAGSSFDGFTAAQVGQPVGISTNPFMVRTLPFPASRVAVGPCHALLSRGFRLQQPHGKAGTPAPSIVSLGQSRSADSPDCPDQSHYLHSGMPSLLVSAPRGPCIDSPHPWAVPHALSVGARLTSSLGPRVWAGLWVQVRDPTGVGV